MCWLRRRKPQPADSKGIEKAKFNLAIARHLEVESADRAEQIYQRILANHLGPTFERAMGGQ